jgi:hypothetical protein
MAALVLSVAGGVAGAVFGPAGLLEESPARWSAISLIESCSDPATRMW